ncbi:AP-5 complex subunit mu-1-like isoform X1 [Orbicella faveolata]|uniref:AP-5 complex subunit mu-1-like isoform X1 n=1 Tax=Orbicella faveolata TaxID=48498 RepID=UPI0009E538E1|nr:AP-5 complex subunit mu-1-like isoform X1 [Orbicella faveolata]
MSLRGIWVFSAVNTESECVLFSRRFPTVERRAGLYQEGSSLTPIPSDQELGDAVLKELGLRRKLGTYQDEFDRDVDSCSKPEHKPVHEVRVKEGFLWPVVAIEKFGLVFICVPLVEGNLTHGKPPLVKLPGVSLGYSLLHSMVDFVGSWTSNEQLQSKVNELYRFLCVSAPFGTPVDTNFTTIQSFINNKDIIVPQKGKQPAWKPVQYRGKQQLVFTVKEEIRAVQHVKKEFQDERELFGIILCRADLEGIPEITLNITSSCLDFLVVHPCVLEGDTHVQIPSFQPSQMLKGPEMVGRKVRFRPPTESFHLCHYSSKTPYGLPVRGIYQMQGDANSVQVSIQLKLNEKVKNSFEYCEVHLPFFHRGPVVRVDSAGPSTGGILLSPDKRRLVWDIGQKFPSKTLEASLNATVYFGEKKQQTTADNEQTSFIEDPFCTGINTYAQVFFKIPDFTFSECAIDPRSLVVFPSGKYRLNISYEFLSADYKIWNTNGEALFAFPPPK